MLRTDLLEEVNIHLAVNTSYGITTQKIDFVDPGQLVTEFFILNRSIDIPLCPQEMGTFSEKCDTGVFPRRSLSCHRNEVAKALHKMTWIKRAIDHECREGVCSIQGDVSTLRNGRIDFHALSLQS